MAVIAPADEFRSLTEREVLAALADNDANAIANEVARLIDGYTSNFAAHVERLGYIPESILHIKARWPIERIAMDLTTKAIKESLK